MNHNLSSTQLLLNEIANELNLYRINTYLVGMFMYNGHDDIVPDIFEGRFVYNDVVHYHGCLHHYHDHLYPP